MTYVDRINAFERWLEHNHLPNASQLMYYKLLAVFNRCGWAEWVSVDNLRLMSMMQIENKKTAVRCRDSLLDAGLLDMKRGHKGTPNKYRLLGVKNDTINDSINDTINDPINDTINDPISDPHNKTKSKTKKDILTDIQRKAEWNDYVQMRKAIKAPLTDRAASMALQKLEKLAPGNLEQQQAILCQSIFHSWKGLFPLGDEEAMQQPYQAKRYKTVVLDGEEVDMEVTEDG